MQRIGRDEKDKRFKQATGGSMLPLRFLLFLSLGALIGSGSLYGGKPSKVAKLDSSLCGSIGGTWSPNTCTILEGSFGVAGSDFVIPGNVSLVIQGSAVSDVPPQCTFVIDFGVTIENEGVIRVETSSDVGFCNLGTLLNSGTVNVVGGDANYFGIANFSRITNSGSITVYDLGGGSFGIYNLPHIPADESPWTFEDILPTITNSGSITIANNGDGSTGILNGGAFSNTGMITVSTAAPAHYGFSNEGTFTNEASGTLANYFGDPSLVPPSPSGGPSPTYGVANFDGTMINYGAVTNEGVIGTNGWAMLTYGTLDNHGVLFQSDGVLVNYGTVNNWGAIITDGDPDYPHNRGICTNMEITNADGSTTVGVGCQ